MPLLSNLPFRNRDLHPLNRATVLQVVAGDTLTPAVREALGVVSALYTVGARALVACEDRLKAELQASGGIHLPLPWSSKNPLSMALSARHLGRLIETERANIIHVRSRALAWATYGAARVTKTPLVTNYGAGHDGFNPVLARYNSVLARGDAVLAASNFAAGLAAKQFPSAADKIRVIRRGIDHQVFAPGAVMPARVEAVRRQWKAAPHEQLVLLFDPSFGIADGVLIEAVRLLSRRGTSGVRFIFFCGENGTADCIRGAGRAIARGGLEGITHPAACCDLPAALLAASVVAVVPAAGARDTGETAIQAQAMGTPVIAANTGAAQEIILAPPAVAESERTGFLTAPGDVPALATAIATAVCLGASARSQLSARAIAHVEKHYLAERSYAEILDVYALLRLAGRPDPRR